MPKLSKKDHKIKITKINQKCQNQNTYFMHKNSVKTNTINDTLEISL